MKSRYLISLMCGLCLTLPLLAEPPAVKPIEKPAAKPVVVPFELLKSGHMAVMIKVNGKGPYRVIFDTGAPINLLNNKLAKETGLLKDAMLRTLEAAEIAGIRAFAVHAKDDEARSFYARFDFVASPSDPYHLFRLLTDVRATLKSQT